MYSDKYSHMYSTMYSIMYSTMYSNNNSNNNLGAIVYTDVDVSVIVRIVSVVVSVDVSVEDKRWSTTVSRTPRVLYGWVGRLCRSNISIEHVVLSYFYIFYGHEGNKKQFG